MGNGTLVSYLIAAIFFCGSAISSAAFRQFRIVGGSDVKITEVPYQMAIEYSGWPFCSATIISDVFALTASHCLLRFSPNEVVLRSGSSERGAGGDVFNVKTVTRNPKFNISDFDYDVAVIELVRPIPFDDYRKAVELASAEPSVGGNMTVSGWGKTEEKGEVAYSLKSISVVTVDRRLCGEYYKGKVNITERMFCAGGNGRDACDGDSGAPAISGGKLVGIVSWGLGCARETYPGVYTNLMNPEIRKFIRDVAGV